MEQTVGFFLTNVSVHPFASVGVDMESALDALEAAMEGKFSQTDIDKAIGQFENEYQNEDWAYIDNLDYIEQCAGLKDKNGNLIYEGDILRTDNHKGKLFWYVSMEEAKQDLARFQFLPLGHDLSCVHAQVAEDGVVVGNIHKNSELFEGKK